jgi:hypothetical protein
MTKETIGTYLASEAVFVEHDAKSADELASHIVAALCAD